MFSPPPTPTALTENTTDEAEARRKCGQNAAKWAVMDEEKPFSCI